MLPSYKRGTRIGVRSKIQIRKLLYKSMGERYTALYSDIQRYKKVSLYTTKNAILSVKKKCPLK